MEKALLMAHYEKKKNKEQPKRKQQRIDQMFSNK